MVREPRKYASRIAVSFAFLTAFIFPTGNMAMAAIGILEPPKAVLAHNTYRSEDPYKILDVLEKRMGGKKISEKAKEKLFTLNEEQTRLILSLCERISDDGRTAGADIAYFLVMALIFLS